MNENKRKRRDKYLNIAREIRNLWKMRVVVVPVIVGALGTVPKS